MIDFKGKDAPGMTKYNPQTKNTKNEHPQYSIKKDRRFTGIEERNRESLKDM